MEVRFVFWKHYAGRKKFPRLPVVTVVTNFNSGTTHALYQKIFSSSDSRYLYSFSSKCWHTQTRSNQLLFKENSRTLYKQIFFPTRKKWPLLVLFLQRQRFEEHFALFPLGNHLLQAVALFGQSLQGAVIVLSNQRQSYEKKNAQNQYHHSLKKRRQHQKRGGGKCST